MKLASIINLWDGEELLIPAMRSVQSGTDLFVIVYQEISNITGEPHNPLLNIDLSGFNYILRKFTPLTLSGAVNEIEKRNVGLRAALEFGCTHFFFQDCDEFYKDFKAAKALYFASGQHGSVCKIYTYFRTPTLRFDTEDGYWVPFIHELTPETRAGYKNYPYYVDPTRSIRCEKVAELPVHMHHMSWVRKDIERKCRNSSAHANIKRGTMLQSYYDPACGPGFYVPDYDKKLIKVDDYFDLCAIFAD